MIFQTKSEIKKIKGILILQIKRRKEIHNYYGWHNKEKTMQLSIFQIYTIITIQENKIYITQLIFKINKTIIKNNNKKEDKQKEMLKSNKINIDNNINNNKIQIITMVTIIKIKINMQNKHKIGKDKKINNMIKDIIKIQIQ